MIDLDKGLDEIEKSVKKETEEKEEKKEEKDIFKGLDVLYCGWGVRPDQYEFARVIACSVDREEIICRLTKKKKEKSGGKGFRLVPGKTYGEPFRLRKATSRKGEVCFKGKYPFESGKKRDGVKKGTFYPYEGELEETK